MVVPRQALPGKVARAWSLTQVWVRPGREGRGRASRAPRAPRASKASREKKDKFGKKNAGEIFASKQYNASKSGRPMENPFAPSVIRESRSTPNLGVVGRVLLFRSHRLMESRLNLWMPKTNTTPQGSHTPDGSIDPYNKWAIISDARCWAKSTSTWLWCTPFLRLQQEQMGTPLGTPLSNHHDCHEAKRWYSLSLHPTQPNPT